MEEKILQFITHFVRKKCLDFNSEITREDNLLEIIDSIKMIELLIDIEKKFDIAIDEEELDISKIKIVSSLIDLVVNKF